MILRCYWGIIMTQVCSIIVDLALQFSEKVNIKKQQQQQ